MLDFNNTEIAFANKSTQQLKKAYLVFKLISIAWLNKLAIAGLNLALFLKLPVKGIIRATVFEQFCGGETIEKCEERILELGQFNVKTILDYSVEGKETDMDFDHTLGRSVAAIERSNKDTNVPFSVFKVTGLMPFHILEKVSAQEELSEEELETYLKGRNRVDIICQNAFNAGIPVMIDAEESWIQPAIDEMALIMMHRYNQERPIVYNTAQMYRHDRLQYIKQLYQQSIDENFYVGIKIVRGAYMEKERERAAKMGYEDPIQPNKAATDADYNIALEFCVDRIDRMAVVAGTHNEESSLYLTGLMKNKGLEKDHPRVHFSQLLGMSDHISFNLAKAGYNVTKYVPYGPIKEVMPYLIRRAEENTSVKGQTGRELRLISEELKRRSA